MRLGLSANVRPRRGAVAALGAYLLTAVEAGLLAGALVVGAGWSLVTALPFACLVALPLLPLQAWGLYRARPGAPPPTPRPSSRGREALVGLGTTLGFLVTAPAVLLVAALVAGALLAASWAGEVAGTSGDVAAALQAKGAAVHDVADLPRWVIVATGGTVFAALGALAAGWAAVLGRLRGRRWGTGVREGLALVAPTRLDLLAALTGGLAVGWLPGVIADVLAASPGYLAAVRGFLGAPTSLGWLDATLTTGSLVDRVGMALVVAVLGPVAEEVVFRGFLWGALERWLPPVVVLVLTTGLFALAHLDPVHTPAVLFVGLFLGWLRHVSGSLAPSVLCHAVNNLLGVLVAWRGASVPDATAIALGGLTVAVGVVVWTARPAPRYRLA
jgi:membrane protease YdiL (CAAX protease family)